jgi:hypothetical protein
VQQRLQRLFKTPLSGKPPWRSFTCVEFSEKKPNGADGIRQSRRCTTQGIIRTILGNDTPSVMIAAVKVFDGTWRWGLVVLSRQLKIL